MRPAVILFLLGFGCLSSLAFLGIEPWPTHALRVDVEDAMVPLHRAELSTIEQYQIGLPDSVDGYPDRSITWFIGRVGGKQEYVMPENVVERTFQDPGTYVARAFYDLREIARDTFTVVEGERFLPYLTEKALDTLNAPFNFRDDSRHALSREWTVRRGDSVFVQGVGEPDFKWVASDTGTFSVRLDVKMRSGAEESDSIEVLVERPRQAEPVADATKEKKQLSPEELAALQAKREEDARRWKERQEELRLERERQKAEALANKQADEEARRRKAASDRMAQEEAARRKAREDSIAAIKPPCFTANSKLVGGRASVKVGAPVLANVRFKKGTVEFTVEAYQDCRLTGFKHFGNENAGSNKITVQCLDVDCDKPGPKKLSFTAGQDADSHTETRNLNMPVFAKGKSYRVTIETTGDAELGFFNLAFSEHKEPMARITFAKPESCVFDLTFEL